jgi:hypothetical protein
MPKAIVSSKMCGHCFDVKQSEEFYPHCKNSDGLQPYCIVCQKDLARENYQKNIEQRRAKRRQWIENNRKQHNENVRRYNKRRKEKMSTVQE